MKLPMLGADGPVSQNEGISRRSFFHRAAVAGAAGAAGFYGLFNVANALGEEPVANATPNAAASFTSGGYCHPDCRGDRRSVGGHHLHPHRAHAGMVYAAAR